MTDENTEAIRRVDWGQLCPWLILFRCFRVALRIRALAFSALAVVLMLTGWVGIVALFSKMPEIAIQVDPYAGCPWMVLRSWVPSWLDSGKAEEVGRLAAEAEESTRFASETAAQRADVLSRPVFQPDRRLLEPAPVVGDSPMVGGGPVLGSWEHLSRAWRRVFRVELSPLVTLYFVLCGFWALVVWSFFGGAIARAAAVELASGDHLGLGETIRFARSKWLANFAAPLLPMLGVIFCAAGVMFFAWLANWPATTWLVALIWPIVLVFGFLMAIILLLLLFGWPLMWPTVGAEGTDSFDAVSRSYAYTLQRPLHYLFYAAVAGFVGLLSWLIVSQIAAGVEYLTYWAASWVTGAERVRQIAAGGTDATIDKIGSGIVLFWCDCLRLLAVAFLYSYFLTAATAIYLLLRRDVDATEMDEVYQEEREETYTMPPIQKEEPGPPEAEEKKEEPGEEKPAEGEPEKPAAETTGQSTEEEAPEPTESDQTEKPQENEGGGQS
ncbi:MAG TPA: hypothetical protein EYP56_09740 [Planctomycetaceae bacterium]|nr:hypothetical protein [Planctomycetaceae bacterium]